MVKLELYRNTDEIVYVAINVKEQRWYFARDLGGIAVGTIKPGPIIGLNLDYLKKPRWLLCLPQIFLHEVLHWVSRFDMHSCIVIHNIHRWSRGLVL